MNNRSPSQQKHPPTTWAWRILPALLILILAACTSTPDLIKQQQHIDDITIILARPSTLTILQDYEFQITLLDTHEQPIDGATIFADMIMPSMPMGTNQPIADPQGNGNYRLRSIFTMDGTWHIAIHAIIAGKEHIATFEQQIELP